MSTKYGKVVVNDNSNQSDFDQNIGFPQPQVQVRPHFNQPVNILEGPGYKLFEAQSQVSKWRYYVNIIGWIFIVVGCFGAFANLIGMIFIDSQDFEIRGPKNRYEEFDYPIGPQIVDKALDAMAGVSTIVLGISCRKVALSPTRADTWTLCKKAMFIAFAQVIILVIRFFAECVAMSMVIQKWESVSFGDRGNYTIINKQTRKEYRYYKPKTTTATSKEYEREDKEQAGEFFYLTIFSSFSIACCCLSMYCACTIGGLYKFHTTTKELDIIQDLPSVRGMNVNRQVASGVPVYQYRPDPSTSVARGQVLMVPNIQG